VFLSTHMARGATKLALVCCVTPLTTTLRLTVSYLTALLCICTVSPAPGKHRRQRSVDDTDTAELLILNSDFRAALVAALSGLDEIEDGRLSIEQFAAILTQLIGVSGVSVVTLLMMRVRYVFVCVECSLLAGCVTAYHSVELYTVKDLLLS
jgi:hypothetical protein